MSPTASPTDDAKWAPGTVCTLLEAGLAPQETRSGTHRKTDHRHWGGNGIGRATALTVASQGARVAALDVNAVDGAAVVEVATAPGPLAATGM